MVKMINPKCFHHHLDIQGLIEYPKWKVRGFCVNAICSTLEVPICLQRTNYPWMPLYFTKIHSSPWRPLSEGIAVSITYSIPFSPSKLLFYIPPTEEKDERMHKNNRISGIRILPLFTNELGCYHELYTLCLFVLDIHPQII